MFVIFQNFLDDFPLSFTSAFSFVLLCFAGPMEEDLKPPAGTSCLQAGFSSDWCKGGRQVLQSPRRAEGRLDGWRGLTGSTRAWGAPEFQAGEMSSVRVYLRRLGVTPGLGRAWVFVKQMQEPPAGRCQPGRGVAMTCIFKLVL